MKLKLNDVKKTKIIKNCDVFDLTVKNDHSYCVGLNKLIVHNCSTTQNVAIGYPMGSLIQECYDVSCLLDNPAKIVADGGMKTYSDVIKALALGADYVMVGSIFNKAIESCGDNYLFGKIKVSQKIAEKAYKHKIPVDRKSVV